MSLPTVPEAQPFYRAALRRIDDAEFLLAGEHWTAAIYLAGYGIECMLKALIVTATPNVRRSEVLAEFRGNRGHNYDWLRYQYRQCGGGPLPGNIARCFSFVSTWDTNLRYESREALPRDAGDFLKNAAVITQWIQGRL
ncbi:MAG: HEPN domain-containing protein [Planctomycetota bacterium]